MHPGLKIAATLAAFWVSTFWTSGFDEKKAGLIDTAFRLFLVLATFSSLAWWIWSL